MKMSHVTRQFNQQYVCQVSAAILLQSMIKILCKNEQYSIQRGHFCQMNFFSKVVYFIKALLVMLKALI